MATGLPTRSFSGGEEANRYVIDRGLAVMPTHPTDPPSTWWVNQGGSYAQERDGSYLWASLQDKRGLTPKHWKDLERLRAGDIVLHYANTAIRAVSQVQAEVVHAPRPAANEGDAEGPNGYLVKTTYHEFPAPLPLADIPEAWRQSQSGPFTKLGSINQGYLYPVPKVLVARLVERFPDYWPSYVIEAVEGIKTEPDGNIQLEKVAPGQDGQSATSFGDQSLEPDYVAPPFADIVAHIGNQGLRLSERTLRRYHLSLATRGFVILAGPSGTGKTWLAEAYAEAVGARHALVSVAPNWTTNEDLLGYFNPLSGQYHDTAFSRFLRDAARAYAQASAAGRTPRPYHLVLDELNLARVEYYFAAFLSAMEVRARHGTASLALGLEESVLFPPNLAVIGTVNIDETTHGFADKVYDRAQLVELDLRREDLALHLGDAVYREALFSIWDAVADVRPFAFWVLDELAAYVARAEALGVPWAEAVDEQLVQKVLPKLKGADPAIGTALEAFTAQTVERFPLSHARAAAMLEGFRQHGFASYFH